MRLKIWCDRESEKFCKIFWELNKAIGEIEEDDLFIRFKVRHIENDFKFNLISGRGSQDNCPCMF